MNFIQIFNFAFYLIISFLISFKTLYLNFIVILIQNIIKEFYFKFYCIIKFRMQLKCLILNFIEILYSECD